MASPQGLPGSGKSTLAQELARRLRWPLVDKDDVRDMFQVHSAATAAAASVAPDAPAGPAPGGVDWNALSYDVMFSVAARQLGLGLSVVLDCPFARRQLYDRACEVAAQHGGPAVPVVLVDVACSDEAVWRLRLEARGREDAGTCRGHKPGSWEQLQALLGRYDGCWRWDADGSTHVPYRLSVCTATGCVADVVEQVVRFLKEVAASTRLAEQR